MCRNKLCKGPPSLRGSCTGQCPCSRHSLQGKRGWGEGSGEGVCSERTAFPPHPPLFLSVMGENLLMTCGTATYLLGSSAYQRFSEQGSRQLLCAALSPVTENLLKQLLAGVSPCAGGCAQAQQLLGGEGKPKSRSRCSRGWRGCLCIFQLVPGNVVLPWCHVSSPRVKDMAFSLQYFKPCHRRPGQHRERPREAFCLPADVVVGNSPWAMAPRAPLGRDSVA